MTDTQYKALAELDRIFATKASDECVTKDNEVREMFSDSAMNRFISKAWQLSGLQLSGASLVLYATRRIRDMMSKHYATVLAALLTFSLKDCCLISSDWQKVLLKGFTDISEEQLRKSLWGIKSMLPVVLVREALLDSLNGVNLRDYSEENLKSSRVFQTLQLAKAAGSYA